MKARFSQHTKGIPLMVVVRSSEHENIKKLKGIVAHLRFTAATFSSSTMATTTSQNPTPKRLGKLSAELGDANFMTCVSNHQPAKTE
ncbi:hypothetical protein GOP47_0008106 [Adiantum capillus-veneris]|uniref:Uncharacterized protein n=1 Tax=Adiantum capillus-veneris TaxID=13818 RepID=A0A9D4UY60_ADICA|nr:hypothetical protein GOP47_0008106 [Adiantum capillus-veneris]